MEPSSRCGWGLCEVNFDLYKRITADPTFGEILKNHLFDEYLRTHQLPEDDGFWTLPVPLRTHCNAEELEN